MSFKVLQNSIFTTIQDQGGAIDEYAYLWGKKLLNNKEHNALEVMVGLKLLATTPTTIAVTGANLNFKINNKPQPIWQTNFIKKGDILTFDKRVSGQRAYLAVKNGFDKEKIGEKLQRGDILTFKSSPKTYIYRVKKAYLPNYEKNLTLQLLLSYQDNYFNREEKEKFFNSKYEVTLQSDRMGYRLKGQAIKPNKGGIISEAIAFGSVQIPKDGQPIVLLKERQTIGGYPKIGTVLAVDCFKLAQISVGSKIEFKAIKIEKAEDIMR